MEAFEIRSVRQWLEGRHNDIIEDIGKIVNIRSVSDPGSHIRPFGEGCHNVLDTMLDMAGKKGFETENFDYYGGRISLLPHRNGGEVGIWSHLDVVPEGTGWTFPPFKMTVKDHFLIGRGVQDNKSPAVGILYGLLCLKELNIPLNRNYSLYVGCSEENTMDDAAWMRKHIKMPDLSLVADCGFPVCYGEMGSLSLILETEEPLPDYILSIEGGNGQNSIPDLAQASFQAGFLTKVQKERLQALEGIQVLEKGPDGRTVIEAAGSSAHIINPEQGKNAATILADGLLAAGIDPHLSWLRFLSRSGQDGYGTGIGLDMAQSVGNGPGCHRLVGCVTGLSTKDRKLRIAACYRYPVLDSLGKCSDGSEVIAKARDAARRHGLSIHIKKNSRAMYHPADDPVVTLLTKSYQSHSGYDNPAYLMSGGTYARKLPNAMGFGMALPGKRIYRPVPTRQTGDFHQADESIDINQLLEAIAIYTMCLIDLDKTTI